MFEGRVDRLAEELAGLSDAELLDRLDRNELERRRLAAERALLLATVKNRELHRADGHRSMAGFCRAELNWSSVDASRELSVSRAVDGVDGLGEAHLSGRIGIAQARKLASAHANPRVRDALDEVVPTLLDHAEKMPYSDFAAVVDHAVARIDEDGDHDDRDVAVEGRRATVVDVASTLEIRASGGDPLTTAELIAIHQRFVDAEFAADVEARAAEHGDAASGQPLRRTDRQRRFDAIVAIFRTAAAAERCDSTATPLVNVVVDAHTWGRLLEASGLSTAHDADGNPIDPFTGLAVDDADRILGEVHALAGRRCETSNGVKLHPHDVLRAALAGHVRRVVVDSERVTIDMGRRQRLFDGNARDAAKVLIRRCEHAGCELPADWCQVDHVDEWQRDDGPTDQRNAAVLCRAHNDDKHHRRWRTRRAANGCSYTIRADGTLVLPVGARPPDFVDDLDDESPEHRARLTALARSRLDDSLRRDRRRRVLPPEEPSRTETARRA